MASVVDIAKGRWPLGAWVGEPDKKLELGHRQVEQGRGKTQESLVLLARRLLEELE